MMLVTVYGNVIDEIRRTANEKTKKKGILFGKVIEDCLQIWDYCYLEEYHTDLGSVNNLPDPVKKAGLSDKFPAIGFFLMIKQDEIPEDAVKQDLKETEIDYMYTHGPVATVHSSKVYNILVNGKVCIHGSCAIDKIIYLIISPQQTSVLKMDIAGNVEKCASEVFYLERVFERVNPILDNHGVTDKKVMVVGQGSLGASITLQLVRAGITKFIIVDFDRISIENICRHPCAIPDVGRLKVDAVGDAMHRINPFAEVKKIAINIFKESDKFEEVLKQADIVVGATGSPKSYFLINSLLIKHNIPGVFGAAGEDAKLGYVLRVKPGETACYNCVFEALQGDLPEYRTDEQFYRDADAEDPYMLESAPGLGTDISMIADLAAKLTLKTLANDNIPTKKSNDVPCFLLWLDRPVLIAYPEVSELKDVEKDYFMIINNDAKEYKAFTLLRGSTSRKDDCPVCNQESWIKKISVDIGKVNVDLSRFENVEVFDRKIKKPKKEVI